jgi:multiple sugar transport system ATP-binding protein
MPAVDFRSIHKQFGAVTVLRDLNLTVADGEFLVLLGPSGCGKTTLLNLLAGLLDVTSGAILIGDRDVTDLDPKDRGLAMVFQSYALYPTMTVEGNLRFGMSAQKIARAEADRRVAWAAKLLQIEPLLNRKPAQLSGGQRQRVAIGRALVKNVGVFLFDEPLSNLDAKLRTEMRLEIKKLHDELQQTIVYVTHDQIEAMTMASRIAVMDKGVIQQIGTPDEIYETPKNLFVARFIGSPAMNVLASTITRQGNAVAARHAATGVTVDLAGYGFRTVPEEGQPVMIGLRPEHFSVGPVNGKAPAAMFELPLRHFEKTGNEATGFLDAGDGLLAVKIDHANFGLLKNGQTIRAHIPGDRLNIFDATTEHRL